MLFSFNKLKEIANLDINISILDVVNAINSIGFEVEEYKKLNEIKGIKFGHILNIYKNPNTNKLNVCEIEFNDKIRIIQTNADNVKKGDYLMAFVPGSSSKNIIFDKKNLQGIESEGMLVSLNELGFDSDLVWSEYKDGIFTFNKVDLNLDPIEYFSLNDYIIDIKVLSNRSDANSYYIMARELAAYFNSDFSEIKEKKHTFVSDFKINDFKNNKLSGLEVNLDSNFSLSIQDSLLIVKSGIKLISPIVDLTNLNLLFSGMPCHAYDKDKIVSPISPTIFSGEFEILGAKIVNFQNALGIKDKNDSIISLAGIMGGEKTSVTKDTKKVILEIGNFSIKDIRNSAKQLKIESNSFKQSSKKISNGTMEIAFKFFSNYLKDFSAPINFYKTKEKEIDFDIEYINRISGSKISETEKFQKVINSLKILGFKFHCKKIIVPNYRHDIEDIDDILEEILRFYGYDNLKLERPFTNSFIVNEISSLKNEIAANGFQEVWSYSLISKHKNILNPFNFDNSISLETFVSKEREEIRNSLAISLAEIIEYNQKRKIENISIFEIGMVNELKNVLCLATTSKSFTNLKTILVNLFGNNFKFQRTTNEQMYHSGVSAHIFYENELIGWIGKISPYLSISDALFLEINLDKLSKKEINYQIYNSEPLKTRDITFAIELKESINDKIDDLKSLYKNIFSISIKDVFIKENEKRVTINVVCDEQGMKLIDDKYNK
ncbi:phenylalanine--tRNA ligase subunit beta [Mesomycoplasma lagogenitalium]|uniref:Phenylalanine--tRNA ligase beta subunit n=1 Tax=Mesomycoplasma lagogenitalium TaxID=171286 RepID=A0ABY8LSR9_9BACT|nr:phenylalanine--tRNA ligase subunit beta [Mesomycoplasma lagogenitalium]WGI36302.1 phenylalanine--tRNA ligase subunit beta [Mesomycoplasma lagogenitalium]